MEGLGTYFSTVKEIYNNLTANILVKKNILSISSKIRNKQQRQWCQLFPSPNTVSGVLSRAVRQLSEMMRMQNGKAKDKRTFCADDKVLQKKKKDTNATWKFPQAISTLNKLARYKNDKQNPSYMPPKM